jgi:hypothetical protein
MKGIFQREISRRTALVAAVLTLVVSVVTGQEFGSTSSKPESSGTQGSPESNATSRSRSTEEAGKAASAELDLAALARPRRTGASRDPFAADPWAAAPAPKIAPPPPPPPTVAPPAQRAPTLPGTFLGRMVDGKRLVVFLDRQQGVLTLQAGDVIDNTYKIEAITQTEVRLLYLPSGEKQAIALPPLQ